MITTPNWMFLKTFEDLRKTLLQTAHLSSLVHCGRGVWGPDFGSCAFVVQSASSSQRKGLFKRLFKRQGEVQTNEELQANFFDKGRFPTYFASHSDFQRVPGSPVAYWLSPAAFAAFNGTRLKDVADIRSGIGTSDNERFLRLWFEVPNTSINFECHSIPDLSPPIKSGFLTTRVVATAAGLVTESKSLTGSMMERKSRKPSRTTRMIQTQPTGQDASSILTYFSNHP